MSRMMNRNKRKTSELQSVVRWFRLKKIYSRLGIDLKCQPAFWLEKMLWKNVRVMKRRKLQREAVKSGTGSTIILFSGNVSGKAKKALQGRYDAQAEHYQKLYGR